MDRESKIAVAGLCVFGTVVLGAILFYGTIAAIIIHFVHKFW